MAPLCFNKHSIASPVSFAIVEQSLAMVLHRMITQRFTIRLRSGEFPDHSSTLAYLKCSFWWQLSFSNGTPVGTLPSCTILLFFLVNTLPTRQCQASSLHRHLFTRGSSPNPHQPANHHIMGPSLISSHKHRRKFSFLSSARAHSSLSFSQPTSSPSQGVAVCIHVGSYGNVMACARYQRIPRPVFYKYC